MVRLPRLVMQLLEVLVILAPTVDAGTLNVIDNKYDVTLIALT